MAVFFCVFFSPLSNCWCLFYVFPGKNVNAALPHRLIVVFSFFVTSNSPQNCGAWPMGWFFFCSLPPFFALCLSHHTTQVVCLGCAATRFSVQWLDFFPAVLHGFGITCRCHATGWLFSFFIILFFLPTTFVLPSNKGWHCNTTQLLHYEYFTFWPPQICSTHSFSPFCIDAMTPLMLSHCLHNAIMPHRFLLHHCFYFICKMLIPPIPNRKMLTMPCNTCCLFCHLQLKEKLWACSQQVDLLFCRLLLHPCPLTCRAKNYQLSALNYQ